MLFNFLFMIKRDVKVWLFLQSTSWLLGENWYYFLSIIKNNKLLSIINNWRFKSDMKWQMSTRKTLTRTIPRWKLSWIKIKKNTLSIEFKTNLNWWKDLVTQQCTGYQCFARANEGQQAQATYQPNSRSFGCMVSMYKYML